MEYGEWPLEATRNLDKAKIAIPPNNILRISMKPNISGKPYKKTFFGILYNNLHVKERVHNNVYSTATKKNKKEIKFKKLMDDLAFHACNKFVVCI